MMNTFRCKGLFLSLIPFILLAAATAQDAQRIETFGGYSLTNNNVFLLGTTASAWDTSTTVFLKRWFGITSDFAGHYGALTYQTPNRLDPQGVPPETLRQVAHDYSLLFGPHLTYRHSRYAPFAQTLFGLQHNWLSYTILSQPTCAPMVGCSSPPAGTTSTYSRDNFAMAVGGGLDIALRYGISLRPIQAEYLLNRLCCVYEVQHLIFRASDHNINAFRYSTGVTFRFGGQVGPNK